MSESEVIDVPEFLRSFQDRAEKSATLARQMQNYRRNRPLASPEPARARSTLEGRLDPSAVKRSLSGLRAVIIDGVVVLRPAGGRS